MLINYAFYFAASNFLSMSYDNAKACAVVETTADVNQNLINVDDQTAKSNFEIQPEIYDDHRSSNAPEGMFFLKLLYPGGKYQFFPP